MPQSGPPIELERPRQYSIGEIWYEKKPFKGGFCYSFEDALVWNNAVLAPENVLFIYAYSFKAQRVFFFCNVDAESNFIVGRQIIA